ncbi:hypothetical protein P7K49_036628 [Saguinus oedipus]|uniref:Uncharacterized protein n=1 Tax=Saguinus oedipus TaxID=9490 RepID=A0ABQ9TLM0_SAGOE|nr:hypothetical protein P7K49_036628 [Saguinus oedipus]
MPRQPRGHSCLARARLRGRSWEERTGPTHAAATPTPPHPAPPPPLSHISSGDAGEDPGPRQGLRLPIPETKGAAASRTPPSGQSQSPLQGGGRGPADTRQTQEGCRPDPRTRNHRLSGGLRISPPPAHPEPRASFSRPRRRLGAASAPGPDNGRSGRAEPEVRLRTRCLAPAIPGSPRAAFLGALGTVAKAERGGR